MFGSFVTSRSLAPWSLVYARLCRLETAPGSKVIIHELRIHSGPPLIRSVRLSNLDKISPTTSHLKLEILVGFGTLGRQYNHPSDSNSTGGTETTNCPYSSEQEPHEIIQVR